MVAANVPNASRRPGFANGRNAELPVKGAAPFINCSAKRRCLYDPMSCQGVLLLVFGAKVCWA